MPLKSHQFVLARAALVIVVVVLVAMFAKGAFRNSVFNATPAATLEDVTRAFNDNDFDGALVNIDSVLTESSADVAALLTKAAILAQRGSLTFTERAGADQALALTTRVLALDPKNQDAWRITGYAYEIMQNYDLAHIAYRKAIALAPGDAAAISQQAHAWDLEGKTEFARSGYTQALSINPALVQARVGLARIAVLDHRLDDALGHLTQAASSSVNARDAAEAYYSMGEIHYALGRLPAALDNMTSAVAADSSYPLALVGFAKMQFRAASDPASTQTDKQRTMLARNSFTLLKRALAINPKQSLAFLEIAEELLAIQQPGQARALLTQALAVIPDDITLSATDKARITAKVEALLAAPLSQ